jgi:AraC family transcriptional regulator of adaptative response / DNA-3-methyladenine glycosylase II
MNREDTYYAAIKARDHRFDGKFFVGVKTTGIYCRPICPAKPKRENIEFFSNHFEAEKAGYRPCLRCRPESAPLSPAWIGTSAVVRRAVKVLHSQETIEFNEDRFAEKFGVTARHLRRLFVDEVGKTPKQLSAENRLNLARKLITETSLPLAETAYAAGFGSIRRFNDAFLQRFKKTPSQIRRSPVKSQGLVLTLPYRPPFNFESLLATYRRHQVASLERFTQTSMHRVVELNGAVGEIAITNDPKRSRLLVEIDFPNTSAIHLIVSRVRNLFDLDSDPLVIANCLEQNPAIKTILKKHPGIRLASGWDPFEIAISTILGQLVSVERGRALVADLVELTGTDSTLERNGQKIKLFPAPAQIAKADLSSLKSTGARKRTLIAFAKAVHEKKISLEPTQDIEEFTKKILAIPGIGPWTASYMALKVLRHTDSFPTTDLILARALEFHPLKVIESLSPWRGYAAALFWREYSEILTKTKRKKS